MDSSDFNQLIRQTTDPHQLAGCVANAMATPENIAWILDNYGHHGVIWLGYIGRKSISSDALVQASHVPDARVLGRLMTHQLTTQSIIEWVQQYAEELSRADEIAEAERLAFDYVRDYAGRILAVDYGVKAP